MLRRTLTRRRALAATASAVAIAASLAAAPAGQAAASAVSISGAKFLVDGRPTNPGSAAEGLLLNSRMVQAVFDDENASTVGKWRYPDTGRWDPQRNTSEFVATLPSYAARGLDAVTVGLQGGNPVVGTGSAVAQTWNVSAYNADGSLKAAWMGRLERVLTAARENGMVVILSLFYQAQDQRLRSEAAVKQATANVVDWLVLKGYRNVLIEVANESDNRGFDQAILKPDRVPELIGLVRQRSGGRYLVSASFNGGKLPPDNVIRAADFVLVHGNGQSADGVRQMVKTLRGKTGKPIVFNEDSTTLSNMDAAVGAGVSWGYHDKGDNNYRDGFQCPPVNWAINTASKRAFFSRVSSLTGAQAPVPPPPPAPAPPPPPAPAPPPPAPSPPPASPPPPADPGFQVASVGVTDGQTVSGRVRWEATVSGGTPDHVDFLIDGELRWTERNAPYEFNGGGGTWDAAAEVSGEHTLTVRAVADDGSSASASLRVTVTGGTAGGFAVQPRLRGQMVAVSAVAAAGRAVAIEVRGPHGALLGRARTRAGTDGTVTKRVRLPGWRGQRPLRAKVAFRVGAELRRVEAEVALPDLLFVRRPQAGARKTLRIAASAVPGSRVGIAVRGPQGRLLGLARTKAGRAGRIRTRVALPLWHGQRRLHVTLRASFVADGRRQKGRARTVVRLSPRVLRGASAG